MQGGRRVYADRHEVKPGSNAWDSIVWACQHEGDSRKAPDINVDQFEKMKLQRFSSRLCKGAVHWKGKHTAGGLDLLIKDRPEIPGTMHLPVMHEP